MTFGHWGKSVSGNERAGSEFRFWNRAVSQNLSSEWNVAPKENPRVGNNGLGATFVSGALLFFFQKLSPEKNRYDNQQVGTSGLGATLVSGILRLLKNWHPTEMLYKRKFASWDERAGSDFRFWNFAVSENMLRLKVGPDEKSISSNERAGSDFRFWNCVVSQTNVLLRKFGPEWKSENWKERTGSGFRY